MQRKTVAAALACVLALAVAGQGRAAGPNLKAAARKAIEEHAPAVVPLRIVTSVQITYPGREIPNREREARVLGTVLDKTGLIVTSNTGADPASAIRPTQPGVKVDSEIKSARLIQTDKGGAEQPLRVVFRDRDLDLMFLRPEEKLPLSFLALKEKGPELELADDILVVSRLSAVGDRQPAVTLGRIQAVVNKPRRFYVSRTSALGCPAFTAQGDLVGIFVRRVSTAAQPGRTRAMTVILPVVDIAEDIKQIEPPEEDE
jgi:hypothetical protein